MIRPVLVQMFLSSAYLCPDCSTIANDSVQCPRCHSPVLSLAAVLNRETSTDPTDPTPEATHAHIRTH
jgi:hypothetical protein